MSNLHITGAKKCKQGQGVYIKKYMSIERHKAYHLLYARKRWSTHSLQKEYDMILFSRVGQSRLACATDSLTTLIDSYLQWPLLYRYVSHGATWIAFLFFYERRALRASSRKTRSILIAQKAIEVYHNERKKFSEIAKRSIKINIQPYSKYFVTKCTSHEYLEHRDR